MVWTRGQTGNGLAATRRGWHLGAVECHLCFILCTNVARPDSARGSGGQPTLPLKSAITAGRGGGLAGRCPKSMQQSLFSDLSPLLTPLHAQALHVINSLIPVTKCGSGSLIDLVTLLQAIFNHCRAKNILSMKEQCRQVPARRLDDSKALEGVQPSAEIT